MHRHVSQFGFFVNEKENKLTLRSQLYKKKMMNKASPSKSVRISSDLYDQVVEFAGNTRPRTTIQYVVEEALERYLNAVEDFDGKILLFPIDAPKLLAADPSGQKPYKGRNEK